MSPPPDRRAPQAVASPPSQQLLTRLLGAETSDAFAQQTSRVVRQLSAELAGAAETPPGIPARLGAFRVGAALGRGGMGTVYRGVHETTGKVAALKTAPAGTELGELLHQEALALGGLDHRGVVQIFDHGEQDGVVWIAMQLVHGETLRAKIQKQWPRLGSRESRAPLTREQMRVYLGWFRDFAIALGAIHARGVVHRDIKPANLMIADDGAPYVIDFGLSLDGPEHAVVDTLAGTVPYMSPEQVLALTQLDGRTDIYSLAACLFELLSGTRLVGDDGARIGLLRQVAFASAPKLSSRAPWVDRACDGVLAKALAKDPKDRYRTAEEFAADLECLIAGREPKYARTSWTARVRRHRLGIAVSVLIAISVGLFGASKWRRQADMNRFRAAAERAVALGDDGADAAIDALSHALALVPTYGDNAEFRDVYGRVLSDFAPRITLRLFQRAALAPLNQVEKTPAGRIGAMATRHLAIATSITPDVRRELIVQAMFIAVLSRHYEDALALRAPADDARDERIEQLTAVASVLSDREVDSAALKRLRSAELANLALDKLCCRAFLLLELTDVSEAPMTEELTRLSRELDVRMRRPGTARDAKNFPAGLAASMHLRLNEPAQAEDVLVDRLADALNGPTAEERPAYLAYAAAARFRRLVNAEQHEPPQVAPAVERFVSAADAEPASVTLFSWALALDPNAEYPGTPAFQRVAAEFFDALVKQEPHVSAYCNSLLWLLRHAAYGWYARHDNADGKLDPDDWKTFLHIAESITREAEHIRLDTLDEGEHARWLFATAIHTVGKEQFMAGKERKKNLRLCAEFRDAAVRLLPSRSYGVELAYASVDVVAHPDDADAWTRFRARVADVKAQAEAEASRKDAANITRLELLQSELDEAALIEVNARK